MYIIGNGRLVTRNSHNDFYDNGAVVTNGNLIVDVGEYSDLRKKYPEAEFINAKGGVIMPAYINTHHHIYSAFARGLSIKGYSPKNFDDILEGMWWALDRKLSLEDTYYSALTTYIDCIKNGVTTVFDHHASFGSVLGSLNQISRAADELGIRTCLCYEVSDRDGDDKAEYSIKEIADFISECGKNPMQAGMMGLHASFTLSDKTLELARKHTPSWTGVHVHVAEALSDVQKTLQKHGKRIINRLYDFDLLGVNSIVVHCVHINSAEMDLIKSTHTMVVHNPESNMGNAVGCPPSMEMMKRGLLVGLGTDGYTSDMLESYKVANILHKHNTCDPTAAWGEIPQMLFENNRIIAERFFDTKLGTLEPDASADIIITDYDPLTPMSADNVNGHILFGMNGKSTVFTMANGRILMKDRKVTTVNEADVYKESRRLAKMLADRINA